MTAVQHTLIFAAGMLLVTSACFLPGADNLTDCCTTGGVASDRTTTGHGDSASVTSSAPTTGDVTATTGAVTTAAATAGDSFSTGGSSGAPGSTSGTTTGTCPDSCETTTGTTTPIDGTSTCGTDGCSEGTSSGEGTDTTTGDTTTGCMGDCTPRRVFVTSNGFAGDFAAVGDPFTKADEKCAMDALAKGLTGNFKAWISVGMIGPSTRLDTSFEGPYVLPQPAMDPAPPVVIAHGWKDLTDGSLDHEINADAAGTTVVVAPTVWTGSLSSGEPSSTCGNWNAVDGMATFGTLTDKDKGWSDDGKTLCAGKRRLYCFEDPM